eukprot:TRINITY_DN8016_c0_g2_i5.p1 TRINITY_DN8016_c0_g2~~TRINITY_DN8016_c0_g2_i5.p1  ORF type:complete len:1760 (-),score=380.03 TRINITY_DN8016_c0_g2_i5:79-5358(-)
MSSKKSAKRSKSGLSTEARSKKPAPEEGAAALRQKDAAGGQDDAPTAERPAEDVALALQEEGGNGAASNKMSARERWKKTMTTLRTAGTFKRAEAEKSNKLGAEDTDADLAPLSPEMDAARLRFKTAIIEVFGSMEKFISAADSDKNNEISVFELKMACRKNGCTSATLSDTDIAMVMQALDEDHNGTLSLDELSSLLDKGQRRKKPAAVEQVVVQEEEPPPDLEQMFSDDGDGPKLKEIAAQLFKPERRSSVSDEGDKTESSPSIDGSTSPQNTQPDRRRVDSSWETRLKNALDSVDHLGLLWCGVDEAQATEQLQKAGQELPEDAIEALTEQYGFLNCSIHWSKLAFHETDFSKIAFLKPGTPQRPLFSQSSFTLCNFSFLMSCLIENCDFKQCKFAVEGHAVSSVVVPSLVSIEFKSCSFTSASFPQAKTCRFSNCTFVDTWSMQLIEDCVFESCKFRGDGSVLSAMKGNPPFLTDVKFNDCEFQMPVRLHARTCEFKVCTFFDTCSLCRIEDCVFQCCKFTGGGCIASAWQDCLLLLTTVKFDCCEFTFARFSEANAFRFSKCGFRELATFDSQGEVSGTDCGNQTCNLPQMQTGAATEVDSPQSRANVSFSACRFAKAVFAKAEACKFADCEFFQICSMRRIEDSEFETCKFFGAGAILATVEGDESSATTVRFNGCTFKSAVFSHDKKCKFTKCTFSEFATFHNPDQSSITHHEFKPEFNTYILQTAGTKGDNAVASGNVKSHQFNDCDFTTAVFAQAKKGKFVKCKFLKFAIFRNQDEPSITDCEFKDCFFWTGVAQDFSSSVFSSSYWKSVSFDRCDLKAARFQSEKNGKPCFLHAVTFDHCILEDVTLATEVSKTEWAGVFMSGGTLKNAKGLTQVQIVKRRGGEGDAPGQYPPLPGRAEKPKKPGFNRKKLLKRLDWARLKRAAHTVCAPLLTKCLSALNPASWFCQGDDDDGEEPDAKKQDSSNSSDVMQQLKGKAAAAAKDATEWLAEKVAEKPPDADDKGSAPAKTVKIRATVKLKSAKKDPTDKHAGVHALLEAIQDEMKSKSEVLGAATKKRTSEAQAQLLQAISRLFMTHIEAQKDEAWQTDVVASIDGLLESMQKIPNVKDSSLGEVLLQMWKLRQVPMQASWHDDYISGMAISPDGQDVVTASGRGMLQLFECCNLRESKQDLSCKAEGNRYSITRLLWLGKDDYIEEGSCKSDPKNDLAATHGTSQLASIESKAKMQTENDGILKRDALETETKKAAKTRESIQDSDEERDENIDVDMGKEEHKSKKRGTIVAACTDHTLRLIRPWLPGIDKEKSMKFDVRSMVWPPGGEFILVSSKKELRLIKVDDLLDEHQERIDEFSETCCDFKEIACFKTDMFYVHVMDANATGDFIAMAGCYKKNKSKARHLAVYDLKVSLAEDKKTWTATAKQRHRGKKLPYDISSIAYSKDGRSIVAGCEDNSVRIFEQLRFTHPVDTIEVEPPLLKQRREFPIHEADGILGVAYSGHDSGSYVVAIAGDTTLRTFALASNPHKEQNQISELELQTLVSMCNRLHVQWIADTYTALNLESPVAALWSMLSLSPYEITKSIAEMDRLVANLEKLDTTVTETSWDEVSDAWSIMYDSHAASRSRYVQAILETIFAGGDVREAIGFARFCRNIHGLYGSPPDDVVTQLKRSKKMLKANFEAYVSIIQREVEKLKRILDLKKQALGFVGIGLITISTAIGNLLSERLKSLYSQPAVQVMIPAGMHFNATGMGRGLAT